MYKNRQRRALNLRYHIRERAWSLTEAFVVRDEAGNPVFEVRGKFFHIGDDLVMFDRYNGQELVHIKLKSSASFRFCHIMKFIATASFGPPCMSSSGCSASASRLRAVMAWSSTSMAIYGVGISQ